MKQEKFSKSYWSGLKRCTYNLAMKGVGVGVCTLLSCLNNIYKHGKDIWWNLSYFEGMWSLKKLVTSIFMDKDGNITDDETQKFSIEYIYIIIHPDICLVVDKMWSNLSQKGDRLIDRL